MNEMFLPPPGLTAQMPLDPSLLFLQKRSGAPTPEELASMSSVGTQILQPQDTIGSAIDPYPLVGASFLLSGASGPVPAPSPPKPDDGLIGPKGPVGVISEASSTGRGNKWFDGFMVVAFLVNIMASVRISMLTKLVDGMSVIKSMNMNMELARQMYDVQVAIGEMKKQMALNEAASLIASAVMMFASAAFSGIAHGISVAKYKKPDAPGGEGVGSTSGNKKAPGAADDLDEAGMTSTAKKPLPGGIDNPAYQAKGPKATFEPESTAKAPDLPDPKLGNNKTANQNTQKMGDDLRKSDADAAELAASKRQANGYPDGYQIDRQGGIYDKQGRPEWANGKKNPDFEQPDFSRANDYPPGYTVKKGDPNPSNVYDPQGRPKYNTDGSVNQDFTKNIPPHAEGYPKGYTKQGNNVFDSQGNPEFISGKNAQGQNVGLDRKNPAFKEPPPQAEGYPKGYRKDGDNLIDPQGNYEYHPGPEGSRGRANSDFVKPDYVPKTATGQKSQQVRMEDAGLDTNKQKVDNDLQPPSPGSERASKEAQEAYDKKVSETRSNRANFHNKYVTTMASPFFQGMQNIAQAVAKIVNAKLEGEMGKLQAIMEMLHGWQKNAQQVGASAQEDYKANQDEVDKLLSSLQKLIDENFKAFNINPKG